MNKISRTPRGPTISPTVRRLIYIEALKDEMPRAVVAERLKDLIERLGAPVPTDETLLRLVSEARSSVRKKASIEDKPWTLASTFEQMMYPEAASAVLRVWKLTKLYLREEIPFTIREAKWIQVLQAFVEDTRNLRNWALEYSLRELSSKIAKQPLETSDLDEAIIMGPWGYNTALQLGYVKPVDFPAGSGWTFPEPQRPADIFAMKLVGKMEEFIITKGRQQNVLDNYDVPTLYSISLSQEALLVYALWLQYLGNGPHWGNLSTEERKHIVLQLREWVMDSLKYIESTDDFEKYRSMKPAELLKEVGYVI